MSAMVHKRLAIVLISVLALTGCAEIGSLTEKAQIDLAVQNLTTELDDLAGITTTYTAELGGDYGYSVSVHATGPELSTDQLVDVALLAQKQLGGLEVTRIDFDLNGGELAMNVFDLTEAQLAADIEYARSFGEAYGSPASVFFGQGSSPSTYSRVVGVSAPVAAPNWDAIRALPDDSSAERSWQVPGLGFSEVPDAEVTELLDTVGTVTPLDSDDPWVSLDWYGHSLFVSVLGSGVDVADPTSASSWPVAKKVAALVAASSLPARSFSFYSYENQGLAIVNFGSCAEVVSASEFDAVLATALGDGAAPGQCLG